MGPGGAGPGGHRPGGPGPFGPEGEHEDFQLEQMEQETEEMLRVRYLNKDNAVFRRTGTGFLSLKVGEEFYSRVQVVRMFPFSDKDRFISVRTAEERSKEIGIVEDLKDVDGETAKMLEEQLTLHNADRQAGLQDIMKAAKLAGAHEFIMRMPDGYDTRIGSSGRELSGGERQRISIARAILANPKILILDEATASVDTETERIIQKALNYLVQGRTTISIAHRLSTLRDADYLVVIDHGEVTEQGTHEELHALKGTYYKLQELQTKALQLRSV